MGGRKTGVQNAGWIPAVVVLLGVLGCSGCSPDTSRKWDGSAGDAGPDWSPDQTTGERLDAGTTEVGASDRGVDQQVVADRGADDQGTADQGGEVFCGATNCAQGCCQSGFCQAWYVQSAQFCGTQGATCAPCDDSNPCTVDFCVDGVCQHVKLSSFESCGNGTCWQGSCCSGCVDPQTLSCAPGTGDDACGKNGGICKKCNGYDYRCSSTGICEYEDY